MSFTGLLLKISNYSGEVHPFVFNFKGYFGYFRFIITEWTPVPLNELMTGVIDAHCHCDPDSLPRPIDAIDFARLAKSRGMRGLVLKNHYESTASMAYLVRKVVPGIEVFGATIIMTRSR
jgi:hypothetical protein